MRRRGLRKGRGIRDGGKASIRSDRSDDFFGAFSFLIIIFVLCFLSYSLVVVVEVKRVSRTVNRCVFDITILQVDFSLSIHFGLLRFLSIAGRHRVLMTDCY